MEIGKKRTEVIKIELNADSSPIAMDPSELFGIMQKWKKAEKEV